MMRRERKIRKRNMVRLAKRQLSSGTVIADLPQHLKKYGKKEGSMGAGGKDNWPGNAFSENTRLFEGGL